MSFLRSKWMPYAVWAPAGVYAAVSLWVSKGWALTVFGDYAQAVVQGIAIAALLLNVRGARKNQRIFWVSLARGGAFWFCGQLLWIYYEVYLKTTFPNPSIGDVLFFLHIVPMLAATFLQPHAELPEDDSAAPARLH